MDPQKKVQKESAAGAPSPGDNSAAAGNGSFLSFKSLLLALLFIVLLAAIRNVDSYSAFYEDRIRGGYEQIDEIKEIDNYADQEIRKQMRWGNEYYVLQQIGKEVKNDPKAIIFLPPPPYIREVNPQMALPEPPVCYYYAGVRTAWAGKSDYVYKCTHAFVVTKQGAAVIPITNRGQIDSLLQVYKGYQYML